LGIAHEVESQRMIKVLQRHLIKGFNEKELKGFFNQFGEVSKLRVSRSKKTARSKGYAFLEFKGEHKGEGQKIA